VSQVIVQGQMNLSGSLNLRLVMALDLGSDIEYTVIKHLLSLAKAMSDFSSEILLRSSEDMLA
jgi:hypothetical protein